MTKGFRTSAEIKRMEHTKSQIGEHFEVKRALKDSETGAVLTLNKKIKTLNFSTDFAVFFISLTTTPITALVEKAARVPQEPTRG